MPQPTTRFFSLRTNPTLKKAGVRLWLSGGSDANVSIDLKSDHFNKWIFGVVTY